ncbi:MAG: ABC transporter ATP-binding protein [Acidobacteriota bacterium]
MATLELRQLDKTFGSVRALADFSLSVDTGQIVSLLGPSGCGKTTALRIVAGLTEPDSGRVLLDGVDITAWPAARRQMGFVFQNYALFPHLDVFENVAFGLRARGVPGREVAGRVGEALALVQLDTFERRRVDELSGGQQQRVAIARAVVTRPQVLLLDEPLSNLDAALREKTRDQLRELIGRLRTTTLFVTHAQDEALSLADRVAVMQAGRLLQSGSTREVYRHPASPDVAALVGRLQWLEGEVVLRDGAPHLQVSPNAALRLPAGIRPSTRLRAALRPDAVQLLAERQEGAVPVVVRGQAFLGPATQLELEGDGFRLQALVASTSDDSWKEGQSIFVLIPEQAWMFWNESN